MKRLKLVGALAAGASAAAYVAYWKDLKVAKQRIEKGRQVIDSVEFAESGDGPAVLFIHGAGGGFDQGIDLGRFFLGDDYRIIAPSRFGYLGTPLPDDASPEAQADAHLRLLDALQIERVPVIGISAGGPSAMQLVLRHPERCSALVLIVPMAYVPERTAIRTLSPLFKPVVNAVTASDFLFWTFGKVAHSTILETILGTPAEIYRDATPEDRRTVDRMLASILPISKRAAGIWNDSFVASTLTRYPLEDIRVPTLVISSADDMYGTYPSSIYTAEHIPNAELLVFSSGGHLLVGHDDEVRESIRDHVNRRDAEDRGGHEYGGQEENYAGVAPEDREEGDRIAVELLVTELP